MAPPTDRLTNIKTLCKVALQEEKIIRYFRLTPTYVSAMSIQILAKNSFFFICTILDISVVILVLVLPLYIYTL